MTPETYKACLQPIGPLRPTFCNVPEWAEVTLYIGGLVAIAIFAYGIYRHWRLWMAGQPNAPARNTGHWGARTGLVGRYVFGQTKTLERRYPGIFHTGIFWGFVLLFIGTALATLDWDFFRLVLDVRILQGPFYLGYEFVLDTAGLLFTLGLLAAIWRRYITAPHHVLGAWDFVLWSLVVINVSGFLVEGLRLVFAPVAWGGYSWVGQGIANVLAGGSGMLAGALYTSGSFEHAVFVNNMFDGLREAHLWLWLVHAGAAFVFIAAIPYTNAVHMFTLSTNAALKTLEPIAPGAALQRLDLENSEFFGVSKLSEFTWKQRLGVDSCVRCGRCETVCPAYMSGSPLNPKAIIVGLSNQLRDEIDRPFALSGDGEVVVGAGLLIEPEALWGCTTCMACVEICPAFIEIVDDIVDMRRYLTLSEGAPPGTSATTFRNMGNAGNPWGYAQADRFAWAADLDVPFAAAGEHYDLLYWVGCSASYDPRNQKIARSVVRLLKAAGVKFAVMREESCNCESARRMGEEYLYQTATEANVENLSGYTFDRVVCHCPHCFNTIKNEYAQFGGDYEVVHHSQLIAELVEAGRLTGLAASDQRVAFHDSCYLGRYNGEFEAPRATLRAAGVNVVELPRSREKGLCCGGGGGKMWFEAKVEKDVNVIRMEEALEAKPDIVGVACPFCLTMLDSAAKSMGVEGVQVMDVSEVLAAGLGEG